MIKRIRKAAARVTYKICDAVFQRMPLKDRIVFECESDMDDNPRAFYEYMLNKHWNDTHKMIWVVVDVPFCEKNYAQKNVVFISRKDKSTRNRIRLDYYLSTTKYFVFSHPWWFFKRRKDQVVVHSGHGTPIKNASPADNPKIAKSYDWHVLPNEYTRSWFKTVLRCEDRQLIICGYPRLDLFGTGNKQEIFNRLFEFKEDERAIICMPTYKQSAARQDSKANDIYTLDVIEDEKQYQELNAFMQERKVHLIIKPHPLQITNGLLLAEASNIHYIQNRLLLEKKIQLYALIGHCDALITDLSSIYMDFILLDRPIGFLTRNFDKYVRGFVVDNVYDYLPGDHINDFRELLLFIDKVISGEDKYSEWRKEVGRKVNRQITGSYCEEFERLLFEQDGCRG